MKKTITLVELIIAMIFLSVIILAAFSFNIASRQFLTSSERKVKVLNDATFFLEHLHKNILYGVGDLANPGVLAGANTIQIRQDLAGNGSPLNTPGNYADDRWVTYSFNNPPRTVTFRIGAGVIEILLANLISVNINPLGGGVLVGNLTLLFNPTQPVDPRMNPEVVIDQQFFFPLSQSAN